jgi:hypothetical protein
MDGNRRSQDGKDVFPGLRVNTLGGGAVLVARAMP